MAIGLINRQSSAINWKQIIIFAATQDPKRRTCANFTRNNNSIGYYWLVRKRRKFLRQKTLTIIQCSRFGVSRLIERFWAIPTASGQR